MGIYIIVPLKVVAGVSLLHNINLNALFVVCACPGCYLSLPHLASPQPLHSSLCHGFPSRPPQVRPRWRDLVCSSHSPCSQFFISQVSLALSINHWEGLSWDPWWHTWSGVSPHGTWWLSCLWFWGLCMPGEALYVLGCGAPYLFVLMNLVAL